MGRTSMRVRVRDAGRAGAAGRGTARADDARARESRANFVETASRPVVDVRAPSLWQRFVDAPALQQGWLAAWIVVVEIAVLLAVAGAGFAGAALIGLAAIVTCLAWPRSADQRAASIVALAGVVLGAIAVHYVGSQDALFGAAALGSLLVGAALLGIALGRSLETLREQHRHAQYTRQRAEERLRHARIRAEDFLASVDDVHFETDASLRVRFIGPALRAMTGHVPKLLLGATPIEIAERHFGRYGRFGTCEARMREQRAIHGLRVAWYDRRGRRRLVLVHAVPRYDHGGHFLGYRGVVVEPPASGRWGDVR